MNPARNDSTNFDTSKFICHERNPCNHSHSHVSYQRRRIRRRAKRDSDITDAGRRIVRQTGGSGVVRRTFLCRPCFNQAQFPGERTRQHAGALGQTEGSPVEN